MENKNYYTSIGIFTISTVFLAFFAVYWLLQSNKYDGPMDELIVRIPGSVDGLSVNSAVRFNGIKVGNITGLFLDYDDPTYSIARVNILSNLPIYPSTKAMIVAQGITGLTHIELYTKHKESKNVFQIAKESNRLAIINAIPSGLNNFFLTTEETISKINLLTGKMNKIVNNIENPIHQTVKNFEKISSVIAKNISNIENIANAKNNLSGNMSNLLSNFTVTLTKINKLIDVVDTKKINKIIGNMQSASDTFVSTSDKVTNTINGLQETNKTFQGVGDKANSILSNVYTTINSKEMTSSLENVFKTTYNMRESTATIRNITDQLSDVMTKIKNLSGDKEKSSLIEEAHLTMNSLRNATDKLNKYIPPIANNLQSFSNTGLHDLQTLIGTLQESVNHFDEFIDTFKHNPQKIMWGTESIKPYKPRH